MGKISDENLDWLIHDCQYDGIQTEINAAGRDDGRDYDCDDLIAALQGLKERRATDKPLDIKGQLRLVRDRCPDMWDMVFENYLCGICPSEYGMRCVEDDSTNGADCSGYSSQCKVCWNEALEGDE